MALFTIENLTFSYPEQTVRAIDDLTLTVPEGARSIPVERELRIFVVSIPISFTSLELKKAG